MERVGLIKPAVDAHTLGLNALAGLLRDCGFEVIDAPSVIAKALDEIKYQIQREKVIAWIKAEQLTRLGLSYRLDPAQGAELMGFLVHELQKERLLKHQGGPLRGVYFAGLPQACLKIEQRYQGLVKTFPGGESAAETLEKFEVPPEKIPREFSKANQYDQDRLNWGRELVRSRKYERLKPLFRGLPYAEYGTKQDSLEKRLAAVEHGRLRPLLRAHAGPYSSVREFLKWSEDLAEGGYLDILSIGTSQLTQANFGEDWSDLPNGGGVPVNSPEEYRQIWAHSRPMLIRTYAGTKDVPRLAALHEETLNICWHAFSFWWFNQLDGRGPNGLLENLSQHVQALRYAAQTRRALEANVSHHFAFRGADDVTYIVSAYLAAKLAKQAGIRTFVLQNMLNTPRQTWGLKDLAKSRALLTLVKSLEDGNFQVLLQPRAGLDYFRADEHEAKAQLAAATALMDDIDPHNEQSPPLIHVVSYSEGSELATPAIIEESVKITCAALNEYRKLRRRGLIDDLSKNSKLKEEAVSLIADARQVISAIEGHLEQPYSPEGFFKIFVSGFLPVPFLWNQAEQFSRARNWTAALKNGGVELVDQLGRPLTVEQRVQIALNGLDFAQYALEQAR